MSQGSSITPQAALLRVLINGESDGTEIVRKVRDWTDGKISSTSRISWPRSMRWKVRAWSKGMPVPLTNGRDCRGRPIR